MPSFCAHLPCRSCARSSALNAYSSRHRIDVEPPHSMSIIVRSSGGRQSKRWTQSQSYAWHACDTSSMVPAATWRACCSATALVRRILRWTWERSGGSALVVVTDDLHVMLQHIAEAASGRQVGYRKSQALSAVSAHQRWGTYTTGAPLTLCAWLMVNARSLVTTTATASASHGAVARLTLTVIAMVVGRDKSMYDYTASPALDSHRTCMGHEQALDDATP